MGEHKHFRVEDVGDVTVVQFRDHLVRTSGEIRELDQELQQMVVSEQRRKLVIDLVYVDFLPSEVLGKLISANRKLKTLGGAMRLCNLAPEIEEIFRISHLNLAFNINQDVAEAIASF